VGNVNIVHRTAVPSDLDRLLSLLDREFVFGKNRSISLALRFPTVFCPANAANIFLCEENGVILSTLAVKYFDWKEHGRIWRGAMIGAVYTDPRRRGAGFGRRLLKYAANTLREDGVDFAVLWTAQPAFYARLGWMGVDSGLLGELDGAGVERVSIEGVGTSPAMSADLQQVEEIRQQWLASTTVRLTDDYRQLPLPATAVDVLLWGGETATAAYALIGNAGEVGIVYEMVGHADGFHPILSQALQRYPRIVVNDSAGSDSQRWLDRLGVSKWQEKCLAMWLPMSEEVTIAQLSQWYIPYFDRI
jgi:predicted N-acetyltransferase YhbS